MKDRRLVVLISALLLSLPVISARADNVYIIGNIGSPTGRDLFVINSNTGASTQIGSGYGASFTNVLGQAFSPGGTLYAINGNSTNSGLLTVDTSTGLGTAVGSGTGIGGLNSLAFAPNGTLYAASVRTNSLYTIDALGVGHLVGSLGFTSVMDLAWNPFDGKLYAIASSGAVGSTSSFLYSINLTTGAGNLVATITTDNCLMSLTVDSQDRFLTTDFCTQSAPKYPLFQIDPASGSLSTIGDTFIPGSMGATIASPEPVTAVLFGTGLAVVWLRKRRT